MDEREQLQIQWTTLSVAQRESLFRAWILGETAGFPPASFVLTGGSEVEFNIASDASSWQVGVPASIFSNAAPDDALEAGDTVIEIGHLFAELRETVDELSEFEFEDESVEGEEAAILPVIIDALEEELENGELDPEEAAQIEDTLEEYRKELEDLGISD